MSELSKCLNGASPVSAPVGTKAERPKRIQRKRTKGWRMPPGALYVGRGTPWGNPFSITPVKGDDVPYWVLNEAAVWRAKSKEEAHQFAADLFRQYINHPGKRKLRAQAVVACQGRDLACFCAPGLACHADVLLDLANSPKQAASRQGEAIRSGDKDPEGPLVPPEAKE